MTAVPDWRHPPRTGEWLAEDLDRLPEAPRHTELIDGALVFRACPRRSWHSRLVTRLAVALMDQAPAGAEVEREMTVRLDARNRTEPDVLVTTAPFEPDRTWYAPEDVQLVIEVASSETARSDRSGTFGKYAEAGIPHYWRIEDSDSLATVHVYELDVLTDTFTPSGTFRHTLRRPVPFEITLDLGGLRPTGRPR